MIDDEPTPSGDAVLRAALNADLYDFSLADLEDRIALLKAEIARCEDLIKKQTDVKAAAENLFKM